MILQILGWCLFIFIIIRKIQHLIYLYKEYKLFYYKNNPSRRWCKKCNREQVEYEFATITEWLITDLPLENKSCDCEKYANGYDTYWR